MNYNESKELCEQTNRLNVLAEQMQYNLADGNDITIERAGIVATLEIINEIIIPPYGLLTSEILAQKRANELAEQDKDEH